jgi:hypothetical protein
MLMLRVLVACTAGLVFQAAPSVPRDAEDFVVLDGSKNPALIPEWLAWETGFTILAAWSGKDSGFNHDLKLALTADEYAAVERAASEQPERRARLERTADRLMDAMHVKRGDTGPLADSFNDKAYHLELAYRRTILDSRDRLLSALSLESQAVLRIWVDDLKPDIKARVHRRELDRYRAPE